MLRRIGVLALAVGVAVLGAGCSDEGGSGAPTGVDKAPKSGLHMVVSGLASDVAGVLYEVTCAGGFTATQYVPLETEGLPAHVDQTLAGSPFADLFLIVPPGACTVNATAMLDPNTPAPDCTPVKQDVVVVAGKTTEIVLVIECKAKPTGALDLVTVITDSPSITNVTYSSSKFIVKCEPVSITVDAEGGNGPLTYTFTVTGPDGAVYEFTSKGPVLTFWAETPGEYTVTVTVSDGTNESTMTFPIHVGDDPDIEHCQEVCCKIDDHLAIASKPGCEGKGGVAVPLEQCYVEVCCKTIDGVMTVPALECPQGHVLPAKECEAAQQVCCRIGNQSTTWAPSQAACNQQGGTVVPEAVCKQEVCCKTAAGSQVVPLAQCPNSQIQPMELCVPQDVCCSLPGGLFAVIPESECIVQGKVVAMDLCLPAVCCVGPDGQASVTPQTTCEKVGGQSLPEEKCNEVCCQVQGLKDPAKTLLYLCEQQGGVVLDPSKCSKIQQVFDIGATVEPGQTCELAPYLVVPSSGASKLAVYDLTTLAPLATSPFATCANPSRILMDGNTDVYATCRNDGKVAKHTRDGVLLWSTQLPVCASSRGIVLTGNGRLFAGCSDFPGNVFELNPATGAVLGSVQTDMQVYGLAADSTGVYVSGYFSGKVGKFGVNGTENLQMLWSWNHSLPYGIAADQIGGVWITGSTLRLLDGSTGLLVDTAPTPNFFMCGVQVGLDGRVYAAAYSANKVYRYDPGLDATTVLDPQPGVSDVHGLTLDAQNNVYTINQNTHNLTRITPANVATGFGGGILVNPYGYSGDMTGLTSQCMSASTSTWVSAPINSGNAATQWLTISWTAITPPGSGVAVYVRLDGGAWTQVTNGQALGLVGQTLEVKALLSSTIAGNEPTLVNLTVVYQP